MGTFDLEVSIEKWLRKFRKHRAFNHGSIREMELHLRDHIDDLISNDYSERDAFELAVKEFGGIGAMAREESWNLMPESKFSSIIQIAMIKNYLKIAARNFWRYKFYGLVNIMGLTIGLSVVFLIGLFVADELSFDRFHAKRDQLYRVVENQYYSGQPVFPVAVTPTALGPSLFEEYEDIVNFARVDNNYDLFELGSKKFTENGGALVDHHFLEMFSFPLIAGSFEAFQLQVNGLILNEELVEKYFPREDPLGKTITVGGDEFIISGIMEDFPKNSHLNFRYLKNFEKYLAEHPDQANSWGSNWLYTYVELDPKALLKDVNEKIRGQIKAHNEGSVTDIYLQPLTDIYLGEVDFTVEVSRKGEMQYVRIFTIVALFILLISCINFMNLSTARSAKRTKEVGLRKTVGAIRPQLIVQFLSESVLLTMAAVVLSAGIVALILPSFNQLASKEFDLQTIMEAGTGIQWLLGILAVTMITGLIAGSYPAIFLSSLKPVRTLKSETNIGKTAADFRRILVVLQFVISVVLIIGTIVVYKQLHFIQNKDLGYNGDNIIYTFAPSERIETFANELREEPGIVNVGLSNRHPGYVLSSTSGFGWPGKDPDQTFLLHWMGIDEHYMATMEMEMAAGRAFTYSDSMTVIINEKAKEVMALDDPVGQILTARGERTIVGVVKDFHFKSIHTAIEPIVIFKIQNCNRVFIKVNPEKTPEVLATIEAKWTEFFPDRGFDYYFLEEDFETMYDAEKRTSTLSTYFAALAILISCLGLFGLVSYATELRTKEIGIRKVLGASIRNLFMLLTRDFTILVLISLLISVPVGWYVMDKWLSGFAYHINLTAGIFILSGLAALVITLFTVSYRSIIVSISNPVHALRSE